MARTFPPGMIDLRTVAALAGLSLDRVLWLRKRGLGPPASFEGPGPAPNLYGLEDVRRWIAARDCRRAELYQRNVARVTEWRERQAAARRAKDERTA